MPAIAIGFLISARTVLETPPQTGEKVDWLGLAFMIPRTAALVVFIMKGNNWGWTALPTIAVVVFAIVCLAAFARIERRVASATSQTTGAASIPEACSPETAVSGLRFVDIGEHHPGAATAEATGDCQPDAAGSAGDERHPVFHLFHPSPLGTSGRK